MKIRKTNRKTALIVGLAALIYSSTTLSETPVRLNFGVYSSNKPSAMVRIFQPTLRALEKRMTEKLGKPVDVRLQIAKDYDQGISHLTTGKVDFSRFGPSSYIEARRVNEDLSILAMESINSEKVFYGIIAVHKDSNINSPEQLKGRSFAFGDEGSTIGRFLSQLYLEQQGIRAANLSDYDYLGRHDKVGTAVGAGDYDAGALNESTFKKLVEAGEPIRELARFPNVTKPWIARSGLDPVIYAALKESLLEIKDEKALKGLKTDGFLDGSDDDYSVIRTAMEKNYVFFTDPAENTDDDIAASQKAATNTDTFAEIEQTAAHDSGSESSLNSKGVYVTYSNGAVTAKPSNSMTVNVTIGKDVFESMKNSVDEHGSMTLSVTLPVPESMNSLEVKSAEAGEM